MHVAGIGVDGGDHPIGCHLSGDAPAPVGAIGALHRFHVLAGDQRQQRHRLRRAGTQVLLGRMPQQPVGIADQPVDQPIPGVGVVPGDHRFTRVVIVMGAAVLPDHLHRARHLAAHPADRADQLGDGVLGGHRVIEHRGIQRAAGLTRQRPGLGHHHLDRLKDPVRSLRGRQSAAPIRQRRGVKRTGGDRQPAGRFPPQIEGDRIHSFGIGQPVQRLQGDHRGHHIGRHAGPAPTRREQVREHLIGKQLLSVASQERKNAARLEKMPGYRLRIQQLTLII